MVKSNYQKSLGEFDNIYNNCEGMMQVGESNE